MTGIPNLIDDNGMEYTTPLTKGAATRYDSPARSLPIALYMGQS